MELAELTVRGFTEEIASASPAPGGGSHARPKELETGLEEEESTGGLLSFSADRQQDGQGE